MLLFIFGMIFGSFGSVLLRRLQDGVSREAIKGILYGRSMCPWCDKTLTPAQLVPLFGRLRQRGKCFRCGKDISLMYPVLELVSGLVFVMRWILVHGDWWLVNVISLVIWWLLGLLLVRDMYTYELHMPVFGMLVVFSLFQLFLVNMFAAIWYAMLFVLVFAGIYLFGKLYSKIRFGVIQETFGLGDVMLSPVVGLLLGMIQLSKYGYPVSFADVGMTLLYFVLWSCMIGLLYYTCSVWYYSLLQKDDADTIHETGSPMIPFLPAMIICYWLMVWLW